MFFHNKLVTDEDLSSAWRAGHNIPVSIPTDEAKVFRTSRIVNKLVDKGGLLSLRTASVLTSGVVKLHQENADTLLEDCERLERSLKNRKKPDEEHLQESPDAQNNCGRRRISNDDSSLTSRSEGVHQERSNSYEGNSASENESNRSDSSNPDTSCIEEDQTQFRIQPEEGHRSSDSDEDNISITYTRASQFSCLNYQRPTSEKHTGNIPLPRRTSSKSSSTISKSTEKGSSGDEPTPPKKRKSNASKSIEEVPRHSQPETSQQNISQSVGSNEENSRERTRTSSKNRTTPGSKSTGSYSKITEKISNEESNTDASAMSDGASKNLGSPDAQNNCGRRRISNDDSSLTSRSEGVHQERSSSYEGNSASENESNKTDSSNSDTSCIEEDQTQFWIQPEEGHRSSDSDEDNISITYTRASQFSCLNYQRPTSEKHTGNIPLPRRTSSKSSSTISKSTEKGSSGDEPTPPKKRKSNASKSIEEVPRHSQPETSQQNISQSVGSNEENSRERTRTSSKNRTTPGSKSTGSYSKITEKISNEESNTDASAMSDGASKNLGSPDAQNNCGRRRISNDDSSLTSRSEGVHQERSSSYEGNSASENESNKTDSSNSDTSCIEEDQTQFWIQPEWRPALSTINEISEKFSPRITSTPLPYSELNTTREKGKGMLCEHEAESSISIIEPEAVSERDDVSSSSDSSIILPCSALEKNANRRRKEMNNSKNTGSPPTNGSPQSAATLPYVVEYYYCCDPVVPCAMSHYKINF